MQITVCRGAVQRQTDHHVPIWWRPLGSWMDAMQGLCAQRMIHLPEISYSSRQMVHVAPDCGRDERYCESVLATLQKTGFEADMKPLTGTQRKYLRGQGHGLKPVVIIGHKGLTEASVRAIVDALKTHEMIKVKFNEFKEKSQKEAISAQIAQQADCQLVGMIGHISIFYRPQDDPEKSRIQLPNGG